MRENLVGKIGFVNPEGAWGTPAFSNDVGGTVFLPTDKKYRVQVIKQFYNEETGMVVHGILLDEKDISLARTIGTTDLAKYDHALGGRHPYIIKNFLNPPVIFFYSNQFEEIKGE